MGVFEGTVSACNVSVVLSTVASQIHAHTHTHTDTSSQTKRRITMKIHIFDVAPLLLF